MEKRKEFLKQIIYEDDVGLPDSVNMDEFTEKLLRTYADFLEQHYSKLYFLLKAYRVKNVNEEQVKLVAAFLAYHVCDVKTCTEMMIRYLAKSVVDKPETVIMSQLHRLGDFRVLAILRTPKGRGTGESRYRFMLTTPFLEHIGEFWKKGA